MLNLTLVNPSAYDKEQVFNITVANDEDLFSVLVDTEEGGIESKLILHFE
jgi:hypothetical protein